MANQVRLHDLRITGAKVKPQTPLGSKTTDGLGSFNKPPRSNPLGGFSVRVARALRPHPPEHTILSVLAFTVPLPPDSICFNLTSAQAELVCDHPPAENAETAAPIDGMTFTDNDPS